MSYVYGLDISYGDKSGVLNDDWAHDLNSSFGDEYVYIHPLYTFDRNEAACGFSVLTTYQQDLNAADYSAGGKKDLYRYLRIHERYDKSQVITRIYLSTEQDGDGFTDDLNKDRGGRYFYLNWVYDKSTADDKVSEEDDLHSRVRRMLAEDCPATLPLEHIQFSQDSISGEFRNGDNVRDVINNMMNASFDSRLAFINEFPPIRVVPLPLAGMRNEAWVSLDNRRLHMMRSLLPPGTSVPVQWATIEEAEQLLWKWTARGDGMNIVVRGRRRN